MDYEQFVSFLEKRLHVDEKKTLLKKLAESPDRFVGTFRASNPKTKLNQFVTQSREIKFGDAIEEVIQYLMEDIGFLNLDKKITSFEGEALNLDQYFTDGENYYFVEQKIRDDHDSTKKRGQFQNFAKKYDVLQKKHGKVFGIMYFIDPSLKKNRNYYLTEMEKMTNANPDTVMLFYGEEFFRYFHRLDVWEKLIGWLERYRRSLPELFDFNFDNDLQQSYEEIITLELRYWRKIIKEDKLWESGILNVLFTTGETLQLVEGFFRNNGFEKEGAQLSKRIAHYFKSTITNQT